VNVEIIVFNVSEPATGGDAIFWRKVCTAEEFFESSFEEVLVGDRLLAVLSAHADGHDPDVVQLGDVLQELLVALVAPVVAEKPSRVHVQSEGSTSLASVSSVEVAQQHLVNLVRCRVGEIARVKHGAWVAVIVDVEEEVVLEVEDGLVPNALVRADRARLDLAVFGRLKVLGVGPPTLVHVGVAVLLAGHRAIVLETLLLHHIVLNVAPTLQKGCSHTFDVIERNLGVQVDHSFHAIHFGFPLRLVQVLPVVGRCAMRNTMGCHFVTHRMVLVDQTVVHCSCGQEVGGSDWTSVWILKVAIEQGVVIVSLGQGSKRIVVG